MQMLQTDLVQCTHPWTKNERLILFGLLLFSVRSSVKEHPNCYIKVMQSGHHIATVLFISSSLSWLADVLYRFTSGHWLIQDIENFCTRISAAKRRSSALINHANLKFDISAILVLCTNKKSSLLFVFFIFFACAA